MIHCDTTGIDVFGVCSTIGVDMEKESKVGEVQLFSVAEPEGKCFDDVLRLNLD